MTGHEREFGNYPFTFSDVPYSQLTAYTYIPGSTDYGYNCFLWTGALESNLKKSPGKWMLCRVSEGTKKVTAVCTNYSCGY